MEGEWEVGGWLRVWKEGEERAGMRVDGWSILEKGEGGYG